MASLDENKALVRRWFEDVLNHWRTGVIGDIVGANYRDYAHVPPRIGPDGARQGVAELRAAFAEVRFTIDDMIAEGDKVVVIWTGDLTREGVGAGKGVVERQATVAGINIYRVVDGKLVESRGVDDLRDALDQIEDLRSP